MGKKLIKAASLIGIGYLIGQNKINYPRGRAYTEYNINRRYPTYRNFLHGVIIDKLNYIFYGTSYHGEPMRTLSYSNSELRHAPKSRFHIPWEKAKAYNCAMEPDFPEWLVTFDTKNQAKTMLDKLKDSIHNYGKVSVADYLEFYETVTGEKVTSSFTNIKYGWDDASEFLVMPCRTTDNRMLYRLIFPGPEAL